MNTHTTRTKHLDDTSISLAALRALIVICALFVIGYFIYALAEGMEPLTIVCAGVLLCVLLIAVAYVLLNPDPLRSQHTERTLAIASDMLEDIREGLNAQSASEICQRLLPETRAMTVAVTNTEHVLACAGQLVDDFPPGSPIHTVATRIAIERGVAQTFTHSVYVRGETGEQCEIPAGIVAPLRVRDKAIGSLKFYFRHPRDVNDTQYALVTGYAELISTQLAIHELDEQDELTARAELRALQAQINPHFLFNTLNTILALMRTDPVRARELLREFASFYRSTLDSSGGAISIAREIEQTQRYLMFEKERFGKERIVEHIDVDKEAAEALVPAFIIQPLVENAVRHAMRDEGSLHIRVSVHMAGEDALNIEVADDGLGMDTLTAQSLFDPAARVVATSHVSNPSAGAGIAMRNIFERVHRFYGPLSTVQASSHPDGGTLVSLHLDLRGSIFA